MNKITIKVRPLYPRKWEVEYPTDDVIGEAFDEDGKLITHHISSCVGWSRLDMNAHHDEYKKRYPDGYELIWTY